MNFIKEVTMERLLDAPIEVVYKAWTDEKQIAQWWGPRGFTVPVSKLDVKPGGAILIHMQWPNNGQVDAMTGNFMEVIPNEKLVFSARVNEDENGVAKLETVTTINLTEENGKTRFKMHAGVVKADADMAQAVTGMDQGWSETLDRLGESVAK